MKQIGNNLVGIHYFTGTFSRADEHIFVSVMRILFPGNHGSNVDAIYGLTP